MGYENELASFTAQAGLLLDLPEELKATAIQQMAAITQAYEKRLDTLYVSYYVDQQVGDDNNAGTENSPFKTIDKACSSGVYGGRVFVYLMGDYEMNEDVRTAGRHLTVRSYNTQNLSRLTFRRSTYESSGSPRRKLSRFILTDNGTLLFNNLIYVLPEVGAYSAASASQLGNTVSAFSSQVDTFIGLYWWSCEIDIPTNAFGSLIGWENRPLSVGLGSCIFPNESIEGKLLAQINDTTGTPTNTIPYLLCNLDQV